MRRTALRFFADDATVARATTWTFAAYLGVFTCGATVAAAVLPYGDWDAFSFGRWSRSIAENGRLDLGAVDPIEAGRPLFYVTQGWLWQVFGVHLVVGRLWSLVFALVLLGAVVALAQRSPRGALTGVLGGLLLALVPEYSGLVASGLTDVPVAALLAAAAVVLWVQRPGRARVALLVVVPALAALTKTSAYPALGGLALAHLIGDRLTLRRRAVELVPLGAGLGVALAYDVVEARSRDLSLSGFLRSGTTSGFYAEAADAARFDTLVRADWLGADLRPLLYFSVAYSVARLLRARHRPASLAGVIAAVAGSWFLPALADGGPHGVRGPFTYGLDAHDIGYLMLLPLLAFAAAANEDDAPERLELARLLVFAAPGVVVWANETVYATRLVSPAWPALVVLMAQCTAPVLAGAARLRPLLALVPAAVLLYLGALTLAQIDGLGWHRWGEVRAAAVSGWGDEARMRSIQWGPFADELDGAEAEAASHGRVSTNDGRLAFFFPGRVDPVAPDCAGLRGKRMLVLLLSGESLATLTARAADVDAWGRCDDPPTHLIAFRPGTFASWVVGAPPRVAPPPGACPADAPHPGIRAVFARALPRRDAERLRARLVQLGFQYPVIERAGCESYDVAFYGLTSDAGAADFSAEAKRAGYDVEIEHH